MAEVQGGRSLADLGESDSDRKFLYAVHCAAHLLLEPRNRLVFANRARPTSPSRTPPPPLILGRKRCPNSPLCFRDFRFGISAFTAPPNMQSSVVWFGLLQSREATRERYKFVPRIVDREASRGVLSIALVTRLVLSREPPFFLPVR